MNVKAIKIEVQYYLKVALLRKFEDTNFLAKSTKENICWDSKCSAI
jgi:hypothetical protein